MPPVLRRLLPTSLALVVVLAAAPAAQGAVGPCLPGAHGPRCDLRVAKVVHVHDGDTLDVRLGGRTRRVRVTGIQAMEQTVYSSIRSRRRGECHAVQATARFEQLVRRGGGRVRLAAQDLASTTGGRLRRSVAVRIGGRWRDVGRILVAEGHALWLPNGVEYAWNDAYSALAQRAAAAGRRLWDRDRCAAGPGAPDQVRLTVNWDAQGDDGRNVNGEWATIRNLDPAAPLAIGGWWFRDSHLRRFRFPAGATLPAGGAIRLRMGSGLAGEREFFWGLSAPPFENVSDDGRGMGDGGYLFDRHGDLRAWMQYPCRASC